MLNISNNKIHNDIDLSVYKSGKKVFHKRYYKTFNRFLIAFSIILLITLFMPWTQNISGKGYLTTLKPDQRPQTIQSVIPGRIEKWYVKEGDHVKKGDTILFISEIKSEYFDPNLMQRTGQQIKAKSLSVDSYKGKVDALERQISALISARTLKLKQSRNKLQQSILKSKSDSINLEAAKTNITIAQRQFDRTVSLEKEGLKALKDVEAKRLKLQETEAKLVSVENKYLASKNEVINAQLEINRIQAEYTDKISKAQSNRFTAQSSQLDTEAQVSKLENSFSNYEIRNTMQYVTAPFDGFINKALRAGIGETFKAGEKLLSIMPQQYELAVETYVEPIDLPLIHLGEKVRIQFDGWPAIIFSGWPNVSYGTYGGTVVAIENFISANGKYRILLSPDKDDHQWPEALRVGSGAKTIALLEDVPIWFEVWRKINSFPPNFYQPTSQKEADKKKK
ncbi:HlyD family efflux transporter periplasmic adaptor subunit [Aquimarina sp. TRL1]|uniref:HlyD family secretion protein n=1 Tax=Aquimarina sp. (strain TRL1) TaxID=2736252 RepID=UPI00158E4290|nr:biotin/lipoyl-binding protein [Aquimarina sp. TRL1]QKX06700.1 HlyD family efflux transporter periplasmic adaptor subunit [Aquimarina sp. TRL1]